MKIALVNPPKIYQVWAGVPDIFNSPDAYLFPPLGVMYLASYLKKYSSHQPFLFDCVAQDWSAEQVAERVAAQKPDVLGVTANTHNLVNVRETIEQVRKRLPGVFVVIGGSHVSSFPEQSGLFPGINAAVRGDGEKPLKELLDSLESGADWRTIANLCFAENGAARVNPKTEPGDDLDALPFPDREGLAPGDYFTPGMKMARATTIISSRGCPFNCSFCSVPHKYRTRSADNIADEMEYCAREFGIQEFHFIDDLFNKSEERVNEISRAILKRGLKVFWGCKAGCVHVSADMLRLAKQAGCVRMHYGVETWSDEGLKALNKVTRVSHIRRAFDLTREAGIRAIAYMIIGCPHEQTPEQVMNSVSFVKTLRPDYVVFSLYTPYPDAPIFKAGVEKGLWPADCWQKFMLAPKREYDLPTVWSEFMDKRQLVDLLKAVHNRFYFSPSVMARTLASMRTLPELVRLVKGGVILFKLQFLPAASRRI